MITFAAPDCLLARVTQISHNKAMNPPDIASRRPRVIAAVSWLEAKMGDL